MSARRESREWALQVLFQLDLNPGDPGIVLESFWAEQKKGNDEMRAFTERIVRGVRGHIAEVDALITRYAQHWDLPRIAVVDRNVLRMSIFEMLHCPDVPAVVSINEAVDIAKYFGTRDSGRFVNGILDRIRKELAQQSRAAEPPATPGQAAAVAADGSASAAAGLARVATGAGKAARKGGRARKKPAT